MSFSVSTCLSHTGLRPLGPTIYVYSDVDSYGLVIDTVLTSDITGENCPYILLVPDNTTNVKLFDPISKCFCVIPISNCDFDGYAYDVSEIICDFDGYAYDVSEIICDIDGYVYDVSEIICDVDGYVYDVSEIIPTPSPTPTNTMTPSPTPTNTQTPTLPPSGLYTYNLYVEPIQSDVCIQNPISLITLYSAFPLNGVFPYPYPLYTDINLTIPYTPPSVPYFLGEGCGGEPIFIIANPNGDLANLIDYCFNPCPVTPTPTPTSSSQVETTNTPTPTPTPTNTPTQITVYSCTVTGDVVDGTTMDFKISINSVEYSLGDLWKQSTYSQLENALNALTVGGQQLGQFTVAGEPYDNAIGRITVVGTNSYDYIVLDYGTPLNVPFVCT